MALLCLNDCVTGLFWVGSCCRLEGFFRMGDCEISCSFDGVVRLKLFFSNERFVGWNLRFHFSNERFVGGKC